MARRIECFLVEPTLLAQTWLRRYSSSEISECPGHGYHQALTEWGVLPQQIVNDSWENLDGRKPQLDDPHWPTTCAHCDYLFSKEDPYQLFSDHIFKRSGEPDVGENSWTQRKLPAGAMYDAFWMPWKGPDGTCLTVVLPNPPDPDHPGMHYWHIDGFAGGSDRRAWTRTGTPPKVTAMPSINAEPHWHGWLKDGYLVDV